MALATLALLFFFIRASSAWRYNATQLDHKILSSHGASDPPAPFTFFEVSRPISVDADSLCSTIQVLDYSFGNTINSPPLVVSYNPPTDCDWNQVILRWRVTSQGFQYDRMSAVWLNGVEIFRTSTAEPVSQLQGIVWQVEKDITRYSALLSNPSQDLAVSLENVIDRTYTGFFNVTLTFDFYANHTSSHSPPPADVILPIAMPTSTHGGYWFHIQNDTDVRRVSLPNLPRNIYRAELEVYVSFHGKDEFWYIHPSNDYLKANGLTHALPRNGPYREVVAALDEVVVGEVCPLPVIFTGGINPLMWRPAAAIGAFDLPSYTLDLTPFVGKMVDGHNHTLSLSVTNAIYFWLVDANLHLWLDHGNPQTTGKLTGYASPPADITYESHYKGFDGSLSLSVSRELQYSGFVTSSHGNLTTTSAYSYRFSNHMNFSQGASVSVVNQHTESKLKFVVKNKSAVVSVRESSSSYPLYLYWDHVQGDSILEHGLEQEVSEYRGQGKDSLFSRLSNRQEAAGKLTFTGGSGGLKQTYAFESSDGCYYRNIEAGKYRTSYDRSSTDCTRSSS